MKRMAVVMAALVLAAACDDNNSPTTPSNTGPVVFTSQLSTANEVPAVTNSEAAGRGTATITFNVPRDSAGAITGGGNVTFAVQLTGFPAGTVARAAHIHPGAAGVNGSPLVDTGLTPAAPILLGDGTGTLSLTTTISQTDAAAITASPANYYFNVHTVVNPGGAVRGQLTRTP
jgi:hypothetical protein